MLAHHVTEMPLEVIKCNNPDPCQVKVIAFIERLLMWYHWWCMRIILQKLGQADSGCRAKMYPMLGNGYISHADQQAFLSHFNTQLSKMPPANNAGIYETEKQSEYNDHPEESTSVTQANTKKLLGKDIGWLY